MHKFWFVPARYPFRFRIGTDTAGGSEWGWRNPRILADVNYLRSDMAEWADAPVHNLLVKPGKRFTVRYAGSCFKTVQCAC